MKIISNNRQRPLACLADLPATTQAEFDYVSVADEHTPRFVCYKKHWYDVHDTMLVSPEMARSGFGVQWDSYISESFFSGVLFRLVPWDDTVVCGSYFS